MRKSNVEILSLFFLFFSGCARYEVVETAWGSASVPMVYAVISPEHRVELYLGKSNFVKDTVNKIPYPEARVFICGADSAWVEMQLTAADTSEYTDKNHLLQVEKGKTYYLRIELNENTLHAQTTVPENGAKIIEASCVVPVSGHFANSINGQSSRTKSGTLSVNFSMPQNKDCGIYLSAFSKEIGNLSSINSGFYKNNEFYISTDDSAFTLNLITVDPNLKKLRFAEEINYSQSFDDDFITAITSVFGGVLPSYSNIENGMGLFGSFSTDSRLVTITKRYE